LVEVKNVGNRLPNLMKGGTKKSAKSTAHYRSLSGPEGHVVRLLIPSVNVGTDTCVMVASDNHGPVAFDFLVHI
jgi:hypothetical protein